MSNYFVCPHCGTDVDVDAPACPECGSDDNTGWSEDTKYDGLFLPETGGKYSTNDKRKGWVRYVVITFLALILSSFIAVTVPWGIYLVPFIILAAVASYVLMEVLPNIRGRKESEIYERLLIRARGDTGMVERWISYERRRTPDADEIDLMEAALYRWERDNR